MGEETSTIRAGHNSKFYTRFLLIGVGLAAFTAWCLYDGLVKYPDQIVRYDKYTELVDAMRGDEWESLAESNGWPIDPPEKRSRADIHEQFWMAALCAAISAYMLLKVLLARGNWMESDGEKITTSWKQTVPYDAIIEIDKRQWANKGIARIKYREGDRVRRFVLDDFKFHREPTDEMLYEMEQAAGVDKIINGKPETDPSVTDSAEEPESAEAAHAEA